MLTDITRINHCTGVAIRRLSGGIRISGIGVSRSGNQLDLGKRLKNGTALKTVREVFEKEIYLSLNLSGKGVVTKFFPKTTDSVRYEFDQLVPGANPADFYVQEFDAGSGWFISFIRRTDADQVIAALTELNFRVIMLTLAAFPIDRITTQLNQYDRSITLDGHEILRNENGAWTGYQFKESFQAGFPVKIGLETVDEQLVIPYANAFQAILKDRIEAVETEHSQVKASMQSVQQVAVIKKKGLLVLGIFFLLLFVNTAIFFELNQSNARLQEQISEQSNEAADLSAVADKTNANEQLVNQMGYDPQHKKSVMIDQLAALMPTGIRLTSIDVNALGPKRGTVVKGPFFQDRVISLTGNSPSILPVNEWLARIRSLRWIKLAELRDYGLASADSEGAFTITIKF